MISHTTGKTLIAILMTAFICMCSCSSNKNKFDVHRIAHAGGGIDGKTYTNSYEALDHNLSRGFKYFEIDISRTSDGRLVCIHDWADNFERTFGFRTDSAVTYAEYQKLVKEKSQFDNCTLDGLAEWMRRNPKTVIVTDVKDDNLSALSELVVMLPDAKNRVIPQVYQPEDYRVVKGMGFESIIWTLYRYSGSTEDVLRWVDSFKGSFAITMPVSLAKTDLPIELSKRRIPTYVHTINDPNEAKLLMDKYGISEIYTDFMPPR